MADTRIVFLIGNYGTGGKERQLTEVIRGLPKKRYNVHLFMKNCVSTHYVDRIREYLSSSCSLDKENFSLIDIFVLKRYLKVLQPDIVFSFSTTLSHFALLINLFGSLNYRLINGAIRDAPIKFNLHLSLERILFNFYKEVVANSRAGLKAYKQYNRKGRHVLSNGYDLNRTPDRTKAELKKQLGIDNMFTIVMVASMGDSKDQETFIKAAAKVLEISDEVQFLLIGDGPKKQEYLDLVLSMGLEKDVLFTGDVENVEEYLKASDLSVLMSTNAEGFPNVVLESLACGIPVIASQDGGVVELIVNGENGYLINMGDFEMLSNRIEYLYKNSEILEKLSYNAYKTVKSNFSLKGMVRNFEEILHSGNYYIH